MAFIDNSGINKQKKKKESEGTKYKTKFVKTFGIFSKTIVNPAASPLASQSNTL